jgi:DNA-binding FrmR family transcriptional regulator
VEVACHRAAVAAANSVDVLWRRRSDVTPVSGTKDSTVHLLSVQVSQGAPVEIRLLACTFTRRDLPIIGYPVPYPTRGVNVPHAKSEKLKLQNRVRRVRGQVEAVGRALEEEQGCAAILHLIVAARGGLNSLMTEVIEDHIQLHLVDATKDTERSRSAEELIEAVQAYLK